MWIGIEEKVRQWNLQVLSTDGTGSSGPYLSGYVKSRMLLWRLASCRLPLLLLLISFSLYLLEPTLSSSLVCEIFARQ
ncbi:hypothetical protein Y032_1162g3715 [Ancylostoma ceylanicum]|uniref:Uncharacterized protein n=1 Tax=Ancylostoma ceylanicum TaxID=53326 RepID=A0A016W634_9BILA|nr:hypothetical protein Y032_1162g3715 [Ancylostoma ceylanicum]